MPSSLQLESNEGDIIHFSTAFVAYSSLLKQMISDLGFDSAEDAIKEPIPVMSVNSLTLKNVAAWMELLKEKEPRSEEQVYKERFERLVSKEEEELFDGIDREDLADLIQAAYFFDCSLLLDHLVKYVANSIDGMDIDQIALQGESVIGRRLEYLKLVKVF
ncbi:hypothetical protein QR680_010725 [Steinernema hermaphroditum]|uniref:SKP1 component POZ domain-containing protein n=1 Tax=Steinernema hermaphroditum TaxID=289476 RepID=A0AA39MC16_9BILA|nr:hypothetical protein QR680_010725 [Steinernema hermaphroditum]